jgi:arabinose-5-phosphate isomerase
VQLAERRGIVMVVDDAGCLAGVVTVGDLTRIMNRDADWQQVPVSAVMTRSARTTREDELGSAAVYRMEHHSVMALPVLDRGGRVEGVVHLHDLLRAGSA